MLNRSESAIFAYMGGHLRPIRQRASMALKWWSTEVPLLGGYAVT